MTDKTDRFRELSRVPLIAAMDHRHFLDKTGKSTLGANLPRSERRKLKTESNKLVKRYFKKMLEVYNSGIGYPTDKVLRQMSIEYTNRYACSGLHNQPMSFNYIEPFCQIKLFSDTVAPYIEPTVEHNQLFNVPDFFDFVTSSSKQEDTLNFLSTLKENAVFHYTPSGSTSDFVYLNADGREFVIGGFALIRHGQSIHWYVVGGHVYSQLEWHELASDWKELKPEFVPRHKQPFLKAVMAERGGTAGVPLALEGTASAHRTIIAGETSLLTRKHVGRCVMQEFENAWEMVCDDPEVFQHAPKEKQVEIQTNFLRRLEESCVLINLAETLLALPMYFSVKMNLSKSIVVESGKKRPLAAPKGGQGLGSKFHYVSTLNIVDEDSPPIMSLQPPHYQVDTSGYYKRIDPDKYGTDIDGKQITGRTWIRADTTWRARSRLDKTVYVKASLIAAKLNIEEYVRAANAVRDQTISNKKGVVYVLRCTAMAEEIYKVGFTAHSAQERAEQLSTETGIPKAFVVVGAWEHPNPSALETGVHAMLEPYRVSNNREFFQTDFTNIKDVIEREIARGSR